MRTSRSIDKTVLIQRHGNYLLILAEKKIKKPCLEIS